MYHYCLHCQNLPLDNIHRIHHDTIYGMGLMDDNALYGRLILEINQAGLSWNTILHKEANFQKAYSQYDIATIANYTEADRNRLLNDTGIIRNRLKVNAAIINAQRILEIQREYGSFFEWIKQQKASHIQEWVKVFKREFKFTGGEIVNEFLMTIGRIDGSHSPECSRYKEYIDSRKIWK